MARLNDLGQGKLEGPKIDPRIVIVRQGFNYRDITTEAAQKHIAWLKESIRERGVDQPISVEYTDGEVFLVDGQCRLEALKQLWDEGLEIRVPAVAVRGDEPEVLARSMTANGSLPPTQMEFGSAVARLINYGWPMERIAKYVPSHISVNMKKAVRYAKDALELHQAPLEVKKAVKEGVEGVAVTPSLALSATRKGRLTAAENIKAEAHKAKERGSKTATRPKGLGVAGKAKKATEGRHAQLEGIGTRMAEGILAMDDVQVGPSLKSAAKTWKSLIS